MKLKDVFSKPTGVYIVAELSANHNGKYELAAKTIKAMAKSGADAVKVQTYTPDSLSLDVDNEYFRPKKDGPWKGKRPYDLYRAGSMPWEWQPKLKKVASKLGLDFFSSPFDLEAVKFLQREVRPPAYKIASFEINDLPLIEATAKTKKPVIISTGLATSKDIKDAIKTCKKVGNDKIILLQCTSQYPASFEQANLSRIPDMKKRFGVAVGVSDHSPRSLIPTVAVALGAKIVEKHFILDRKLGGPDSSFSMEPKEFMQMVDAVRQAEASLGRATYEVSNKDLMRRRSLFVTKKIKKDEKFTQDNIRSVRPGFGLAPKYLGKVLGKRAKSDLKRGTPLSREHIG